MKALINTSKRGAMFVKACFLFMLGLTQLAFAQSNSIESVVTNQQGANIVVKIGMKNPLEKQPAGFSIATPSRIALDFPDVVNGTGKSTVDVNIGDLRTVTLVEASGRTRMIFNLNKPLNYAATIEGKYLIVTIDGSGG
ncbi:AMIN domain-containing protein, partial [Undibacterium luofuense]